MQPQRPGPPSGGRHRRRPRRKVVVRDLPPTLPAEVFWQSVSPWVQCTATGETATSRDRPIQPAPGHAPTALYAEYVPGKKRETAAEDDIPSVAYIQFRDPAKELAFAKAFHGHVFRDSKGMCDMLTHPTGVESTALVDYALVSTLPTSRKPQPDPLIGTVEQTPEFQAFHAMLASSENGDSEPTPAMSTTSALVQFLQENKKAKEKKKRRSAKDENTKKPGSIGSLVPKGTTHEKRPPLELSALRPAPTTPADVAEQKAKAIQLAKAQQLQDRRDAQCAEAAGISFEMFQKLPKKAKANIRRQQMSTPCKKEPSSQDGPNAAQGTNETKTQDKAKAKTKAAPPPAVDTPNASKPKKKLKPVTILKPKDAGAAPERKPVTILKPPSVSTSASTPPASTHSSTHS